VEEEKRATPVDEKGWSLSTHFFNTAIITFSSLCFIMSAVMWLSCPDPGAMAEAIDSLFLK